MRTIGIRVTPHAVTFAVIDVSGAQVLNVEEFLVPKALSRPEALKYVRNTTLDILYEYQIDKAGLRVTESAAQKPNLDRIQMEGVIQEAFASSPAAGYYCGQISNITSLLSIDRADFKPLVSGDKDYPGIRNWNKMTRIKREALLVALGAQHA